jgi:ATP-binding cassette, subfamily C, bacterial CydC
MIKNVFRLIYLLKPFLGWVILSVFLGSATIACGIGLLGTSAYLIAMAALHPSIAVLQVSIVGVRFFGISRGVFRYLERLTSHSLNFRLLSEFRVLFYQAIEPLAPARLGSFHGGDLLDRVIGDIEVLENFYVRVVAPPFVAIFITAGAGLFVGTINAAAGWIIVLGLLVTGFLIPLLSYFMGSTPARSIISERSKLSESLVDGIQGMEDLLAFGEGEKYQLRIKKMSCHLNDLQQKMALVSGIVGALNLLFSNLTVIGILLITIPLTNKGQLSGILLPVLSLVTLASFEAVTPLGIATQYLRGSLEAADRLFGLMKTKPDVVESRTTTPFGDLPVIKINNLIFRYGSIQQPALKGISFSLQPGSRTALVGPNGAGKSTLTNLLLRFWEFENGTIELNGADIRSLAFKDIRKTIGILPQSIYLFCAPIRDNLQLAKKDATDEEMKEVLDQVQMSDWLCSLPEGLDTWIGEHGLSISGGQRQRLGLARTLLQNTPILILDEPTAHLDIVTENHLIQSLLKILKGRTTLWITHRLSGLDRMDNILVLDSGEIVEHGRHEELLKSGGLYAHMWLLQNEVIIKDPELPD